jgi:methionyl-tRNA formyltransferase
VIWALALGLTRTASTFFFMDEGADSGDILSQVEVEIEDSDDAGTLYRKLNDLALRQICDFTPKLAQGTFERIPQDNSRANTWRKRNAQDGQIDWRMSSSSIRNLVRALARPYPGAHCVWQGQDVKIWKVERVEWNQPNLEPGKVLSSGADGIVVKSGDGAIRIVTHEFSQLPQEGSYL